MVARKKTGNTEKCVHCRFFQFNSDINLVCHNDESGRWGKTIDIGWAKGNACEDFSAHRYQDMTLKEALRIMTDGRLLFHTTRRYRMPNGEDLATQTTMFKSNRELEEYNDAFVRLFREYIDMAEADGDFLEHEEDKCGGFELWEGDNDDS